MTMHLSVLCKAQQDAIHKPCSGTCDCCDSPQLCECSCHQWYANRDAADSKSRGVGS